MADKTQIGVFTKVFTTLKPPFTILTPPFTILTPIFARFGIPTRNILIGREVSWEHLHFTPKIGQIPRILGVSQFAKGSRREYH